MSLLERLISNQREWMLAAGVISLLTPLVLFYIGYQLKNRVTTLNTCKRILLLVYMGVIIYVTLFMRTSYQLGAINLRPFWSYAFLDRPHIRWQIYMNIFLFIPFGFVLRWNYKLGIIPIALIGMAFSGVMETVQYIFGLGTCEVDDVIHNTLGSVLGYGYYRLMSHFLEEVD